jgi:hypothetical protein
LRASRDRTGCVTRSRHTVRTMSGLSGSITRIRSGEQLGRRTRSFLSPATIDNKHRFRTVRPYEYREAAALLADFWSEVDAVLEEIPIRQEPNLKAPLLSAPG